MSGALYALPQTVHNHSYVLFHGHVILLIQTNLQVKQKWGLIESYFVFYGFKIQNFYELKLAIISVDFIPGFVNFLVCFSMHELNFSQIVHFMLSISSCIEVIISKLSPAMLKLS